MVKSSEIFREDDMSRCFLKCQLNLKGTYRLFRSMILKKTTLSKGRRFDLICLSLSFWPKKKAVKCSIKHGKKKTNQTFQFSIPCHQPQTTTTLPLGEPPQPFASPLVYLRGLQPPELWEHPSVPVQRAAREALAAWFSSALHGCLLGWCCWCWVVYVFSGIVWGGESKTIFGTSLALDFLWGACVSDPTIYRFFYSRFYTSQMVELDFFHQQFHLWSFSSPIQTDSSMVSFRMIQSQPIKGVVNSQTHQPSTGFAITFEGLWIWINIRSPDFWGMFKGEKHIEKNHQTLCLRGKHISNSTNKTLNASGGIPSRLRRSSMQFSDGRGCREISRGEKNGRFLGWLK